MTCFPKADNVIRFTSTFLSNRAICYLCKQLRKKSDMASSHINLHTFPALINLLHPHNQQQWSQTCAVQCNCWASPCFVVWRQVLCKTDNNGVSLRGLLKCDGIRAEIRFRHSAKGTSPFESAGSLAQSTTGSRVVRIKRSIAGYTMFRGSVKGTGFPIHSPDFPSLHLPCVAMCHHISAGF